MEDVLLLIDIGNTSTTLGLYRAGAVVRRAGAVHPSDPVQQLRDFCQEARVRAAAVCSVVPRLTGDWTEAISAEFALDPLVVHHTLDLGIPVTYPRPETIGPDRLANAVGASIRHGRPVVVADFGTGLTFDIVSETEGYIGGVIAPGLPLMFDYLAEKTALLPHIGPEPVTSAIGKSTEHAMRAGAQIGYRGMVKEILAALRAELRVPGLTVCATGGYAEWVMREVDPTFKVEPDLTLFGIAAIHLRNRTDFS
jgi:type III pantothenate kinase